MSNKIVVTVEGETTLELVRNLRLVANQIAGPSGAAIVQEGESDKQPARGKKATKEEPEETTDLGIGEDEEETATEETPTLDDVIKSFRAFAKHHGAKGKDKAAGMLKKLGVTSVQDLDEAQYAKALSLTEV